MGSVARPAAYAETGAEPGPDAPVGSAGSTRGLQGCRRPRHQLHDHLLDLAEILPQRDLEPLRVLVVAGGRAAPP